MTRQDAVLIADAAGLSIFALGRDREKFLLALEIFTTMVEAAERRKLEGQIETLDEMRKPLMDEEIETYRHMIDWTAHWSYINFARAIEAAHGIKE